jgi:GH24 family phage-related lysozyme (muramidase)
MKPTPTQPATQAKVPPTKISPSAVDFIADYEGGFYSTPYNDLYGNPTIGYGHLIQSGENFTSITESEAKALFASDLGGFEKMVYDYSMSKSIVWDQNQFDALVSVAYNSGNGFKSIVDNLLAGQDAVSAFTWIYTVERAKNGELGLWRRRMDEADMFIYGTYNRTYRNP